MLRQHALKRTVQDNKDFCAEALQTVERDFYVDDWVKSVESNKEAIDLIQDVYTLLTRGGFKLNRFSCNKAEVLAELPEDQVKLQDNECQVLGLIWNTQDDMLQVDSNFKSKSNTKRGILSMMSAVYDPLGIVSPFTYIMKVLMQELWRLNFLWDDEIPYSLLHVWQQCLVSLRQLPNIRVPRHFKHYTKCRVASIQLHCFSDASNKGLAAVCYIRIIDIDGNIGCYFVMGKTKNAPMKEWSTPRLELQAAVIATRIHSTVMKEIDIPINESHFWTDSMITLQYIRNTTRRFQPFVSNRLTEIHERTSINQWKHVPGTLNPADDGSRGLRVEQLTPDCR
ncbi:Uncharacterised protein r2_g2307 [Pycnogonum litorale]